MIEVTYELIMHVLIFIVYLIATIIAFNLVKKLYGTNYTNALPYFIMAIVLILGMVTFHIFDLFFPILEESELYLHSIQMLQLIAGFFFIKALYEIYQTNFATEGFIGFEEKKGGKK